MKLAEKRIRQLEHLHLPSKPGPPYYWDEFQLLYALGRNIPKVWPDPDAMPKFIRDACRELGGILPVKSGATP